MLARNFKTAEELGIFEKEKEALIKVLGMLERGELVHEKYYHEPTVQNGFNMAILGKKTDCGTCRCILGWAQHLGGDFFSTTRALVELFMYGDRRRYTVTNEQAAIALRNYLTTGNANWDEILG